MCKHAAFFFFNLFNHLMEKKKIAHKKSQYELYFLGSLEGFH